MATSSTLQDTLLALHFEPLPLSILDMAAWASPLLDRYPFSQDVQAAGPLDLGPAGLTPQFALVAGDELPRLVLRSADSRSTIQLQRDRFLMTWNRAIPIGEPDDFPEFDEMLTTLESGLKEFADWRSDRFGGVPLIARAVEVGWINLIPLVSPDGQRKRLSDVFASLSSTFRLISGFGMNWMEFLNSGDITPENLADTPRVNASAGMGTVFPGLRVASLQLVGLGPVGLESDDLQPALLMLRRLHERIVDIQAATIISS